ncbi:unnamed protein product [Paramecium sonneborni]|uniref:Uncharacterized protein n=1 Tax=Paramecium sonneborni TaxID=65129 RepID=A0A8S1KYZ8_9CILI|nr:unnamed protein product [Paramecium sonneborni]
MQQQQQRNSLVQELLKSINQSNQSLTNQNKVLHEFQWFQLDNQIRIRVHELMEPHLKLFLDQRFEYDTINVKLEKHLQNYEEFKSLYFQNGKSQPIIQQLKLQINDLESRLEKLQQTEQFSIIEINKKLDLFQISEDQHIQQFKLIEDHQNQAIQLIENFKQQNQDFKQLLLENLDQVNQQNQLAVNDIQDKLLKLNHQISNQQSYQNDFTLKNQNILEELNLLNNKIIQCTSQNSYNQKNIEILQQIIPKYDELLVSDRYVNNQQSLMKNKLLYFENYLEKYFPLFLQGTISETLHNCLEDNNLYKLAKFEENKFTLLHSVILNDQGIPNLEKKINDSTQYIEKQLKRNQQVIQNYVEKSQIIKNDQIKDVQNVKVQQEIKQHVSDTKSLLEKNEIEHFIEQQLIELKKQINQEINFFKTRVEQVENNYNILHQQMISQFESIKIQNNEQIQKIQQQQQELSEQFVPIPLFINEINEIQQQQQFNIQKLNQFLILQAEINSPEILYNGIKFSQEQCQDILNELIDQLKNENDCNYQESPIKKLKQQLNVDDKRSIRTKTTSQSGMRKSIKSMYSSSQTRTTMDKRKFYLLGSKLQQEVCQSMNLSILQPRKTNSRILFQSKLFVKD